jgi:hypothetical protein
MITTTEAREILEDMLKDLDPQSQEYQEVLEDLEDLAA